MKTKELIKVLQKMVDEHEPYMDVMGEHEIVIDVFQLVGEHTWEYKGFSPNISIQRSQDGVYDIITAEETWN